MIEKDGIGAKDTTQKVRPLRAEAVLRTAYFIEDKTNYDSQKRDGLFTLQPRTKRPSSRLIERRVQERFTVGYIHRNSGLPKQQQRLSSKGCPTRSTIFAKNTKRNSESHKDLKPSICGSYREGIKATIRGNFKHLENCKSGALRNNDKTNEEINFSDLEISLFSVFDSALVFSFLRVFISALHKPFIMSISVLSKAQIGTKQKS